MKKKNLNDDGINTSQKLEDATTRLRALLPKDLIKKLAHSKPRRLRMCMGNTGQMRNY